MQSGCITPLEVGIWSPIHSAIFHISIGRYSSRKTSYHYNPLLSCSACIHPMREHIYTIWPQFSAPKCKTHFVARISRCSFALKQNRLNTKQPFDGVSVLLNFYLDLDPTSKFNLTEYFYKEISI